TLRARQPRFDVRHALGGEGAVFGVGLERMRRAGPAAADEFRSDDPDEPKSTRQHESPPNPPLMHASEMSPEQLRIWRAYLAAGEAHLLGGLLRLRAAADRPDEYDRTTQELDFLWNHRQRNPVGLYSAILLPVLARVGPTERRYRAKVEI